MNNKRKLRKLLSKAQVLLDEDHDKTTMKQIKKILCTSNDIMNEGSTKHRAAHTDEVLLDAKVLSTVTKICVVVVNDVDINMQAYVDDEFSNHLLQYLEKDTDIDWNRLEDLAEEMFLEVPVYSFLYGSFSHIEASLNPPPKERQTRLRLQPCEKKQPENISHLDRTEENVDETVKIMYKILKEIYKENNSQPVSYYHFVIHPTDFGQTVENIFHFAFLVRDGAIRVSLDDDGAPYVVPVSSKDSRKRPHNDRAENTQRVMSLDMAEWQDIIDTCQIVDCIYNTKRLTWQK